jgi:hypothetical protein
MKEDKIVTIEFCTTEFQKTVAAGPTAMLEASMEALQDAFYVSLCIEIRKDDQFFLGCGENLEDEFLFGVEE